jgi:hypothetical protein
MVLHSNHDEWQYSRDYSCHLCSCSAHFCTCRPSDHLYRQRFSHWLSSRMDHRKGVPVRCLCHLHRSDTHNRVHRYGDIQPQCKLCDFRCSRSSPALNAVETSLSKKCTKSSSALQRKTLTRWIARPSNRCCSHSSSRKSVRLPYSRGAKRCQ